MDVIPLGVPLSLGLNINWCNTGTGGPKCINIFHVLQQMKFVFNNFFLYV